MSDSIKTNFTPNTGSTKNPKDKMADGGAEIKERAGDALRASGNIVKDTFKEATDAAKDVASGMADQIEDQGRATGGDFIERLAGNIREAARAFESDVPFAARGINSAADYVDDAAEKVHNGSLRDLVDGATDFAKRQPAAFLGISVLAGFAAVRFLRASGGQPSSLQGHHTENTSWAGVEARNQNKSTASTPFRQDPSSGRKQTSEPTSSLRGDLS